MEFIGELFKMLVVVPVVAIVIMWIGAGLLGQD